VKTSNRSRTKDGKRVSSEKHEVGYVAAKSGKKAATVRKVKKTLGRKTSRKTVMSRLQAK
jgi:predicted RNA-binding protein YlqC (UPF0109 family)